MSAARSPLSAPCSLTGLARSPSARSTRWERPTRCDSRTRTRMHMYIYTHMCTCGYMCTARICALARDDVHMRMLYPSLPLPLPLPLPALDPSPAAP